MKWNWNRTETVLFVGTAATIALGDVYSVHDTFRWKPEMEKQSHWTVRAKNKGTAWADAA